jgi:hypothetical protein
MVDPHIQSVLIINTFMCLVVTILSNIGILNNQVITNRCERFDILNNKV